MSELPKTYEPAPNQERIARRWLERRAFRALPDGRGRERRYVVMMPLPNVTGALHMGHAMDNVMQDLLVRWHRMQGDNALWQPGTDHAGIATQAVVEKRLRELEGLTRHDVGREALVARIWAWKDEYQARIVRQQQEMGCSCDWERQRFTMDKVCSAAVREAFYRLFRDGLIFRGDRLVNWDCHLQTAVADDELYHATVQGHFFHLRYPLKERGPGEPEHVVVATTRPETMLGDTAVAVHPDPARALERRIAEARAALAEAKESERAEAEAELARLLERRETHLPRLVELAALARAGRRLRLPLVEREIPLIVDEWAKPELGSGCVKITPAHDPNDYRVWQRHRDAIGILNVLRPDGTLNEVAGPYAGLERFAARKRVVADLEAQGLLEAVEQREVEIGHSDRSKTPIEPYLSKQWFVRMGDVPGGVVLGRGTPREQTTSGLAQAAIDAAEGPWRSPSGRKLAFHPDPERYRGTYVAWLSEKRDWCISRQLWWGHRIPVWRATFADAALLEAAVAGLPQDPLAVHAWVADGEGAQLSPAAGVAAAKERPGDYELQVCLRDEVSDQAYGPALVRLGLSRDEDVLDTWFSSALWPFSTLGWPDPQNAPLGEGQAPLGAAPGRESALDYYYPGSCLVTGRDILTLWVARMVLMGLYALGDLPFEDVFLHAKILDGKGETMSKSKGNGIDPVDIIRRYGADGMRYVIADMQTGAQDARLPAQAECPHCRVMVELAQAAHGKTRDGGENLFTYLCTACQGEFDVLGMSQLPAATITSDRFEEGRNFCNKLWNAARFALMNLGQLELRPLGKELLAAEDRWILSRLSRAVAAVDERLRAYNPSAALAAARDFFWGDFCDWYLELVKPRMRDEGQAPIARQVLATVLDQVLRLFHPFVPFITEAIWEQLNAQAPERGIAEPLPPAEMCVLATWPRRAEGWEDAALEAEVELLRGAIRCVRDLRAKYTVPPKQELPAAIQGPAPLLATLRPLAGHLTSLGKLSALELGEAVARPRNAAAGVVGELSVFLGDVLDPEKERARLTQQRQKLAGQLQGAEKKLGNEGFLKKAQPEVVAAERARVEDLRAQLALIEQNLAAL